MHHHAAATNKSHSRDCTWIGKEWASSTFLGEGSYQYIVLTSMIAYWFLVSLIPVYNKYYFKKSLYPYPIATACIQLSVVSLLLIVINAIQHDYNSHESEKKKSWIFGPHFLYKVKWTAPVGVLFGIKYGITNLGLHMVPAPTHLLLQSTDLVWTLLCAWVINGERVTRAALACVYLCVIGSIMLSFQVGETIAAPLPAIAVNLLSPIFLGLCITTLRLGCTELMRPDNRVGGTVSAVELSALKLAISAIVALCLACLFENDKEVVHADDVMNSVQSISESQIAPSWLEAFKALPKSTQFGVVGGSIPILAFQVNCTFLCFLISAFGVGLVGQVKIIPQWAVAAIFARSHFQLGLLNGLGAVLIMTSAVAFALNNWLSHKYPGGRFKRASLCLEHDEFHLVSNEKHSLLAGIGDEQRMNEGGYASISTCSSSDEEELYSFPEEFSANAIALTCYETTSPISR